MKRFKKGQEIYQVGKWSVVQIKSGGRNISSELVTVRIWRRVVDSCGSKKITFIDRGMDYAFGRSNCPDNPALCATVEEAIARGLKDIEEAKVLAQYLISRDPGFYALKAENVYVLDETVRDDISVRVGAGK